MAKDLKRGVLVWAKMRGFPPWPAKVAFPSDGKPPKSKKPQHYVYFFGTHNYAYVPDSSIFLHSEERLASAKSYKKISSTMQTAIQEMEHACRKDRKKFKLLTKDEVKKEPVSPPPSPLENIPEKAPKKSKKAPPKKKIKVELETEVETKTPNIVKKTPHAEKKTSKVERKTRKFERKATKIEKKTPNAEKKTPKVERKTRKLEGKTSKIEKKSTKKNSKKRPASAMGNNLERDVKIEVKKEEDSDEDYSLLVANVPPNNGYLNEAVIPPYSDDSKPHFTSVNFIKHSTSSGVSNCPIKRLKYAPTSKKIGFLGLGLMGCELLKRLLATGHTVTIWNRSIHDKYTTFVEMGAKTARHPADVVQECDIILCCVSDAEASKSVVFGRHGVLAGFGGLGSNKAYVELTSIDPVTSQEIGEAITGKGARYLEAPMFGTRQNVSESAMTIVTAGDRSLFTDCRSVFASCCSHVIFLSCEVGAACKMSLCLNMMSGTTFAALAELINTTKDSNINPAFFMDVIATGPANFPLLLDKGHAMITNSPTVYTPIKHQQNNMAMALELGNTSQQPLALASAANELYKRAMQEDKESDISAIRKWLT